LRSAAALAAAFSPAVAAPQNSASILRSLSRRAASSFILVLVGASPVKPAMDHEGRKVHGAWDHSRRADGRRHAVAAHAATRPKRAQPHVRYGSDRRRRYRDERDLGERASPTQRARLSLARFQVIARVAFHEV